MNKKIENEHKMYNIHFFVFFSKNFKYITLNLIYT